MWVFIGGSLKTFQQKKPLSRLLMHGVPFYFDKKCMTMFTTLKDKLTSTPIVIALDWELPFELMCDVSDYVVGAVLGQQKKKVFHSIYYARKALNEA